MMGRITFGFLLAITVAGCADTAPLATPTAESEAPVSEPVAASPSELSASDDSSPPSTTSTIPAFKPLTLDVNVGVDQASKGSSAAPSADQNVADVISRLKPLQVMLGQWRGTTRRDYDGFKAVDSHEWVWDLQSQPEQPALVMKSDKSPYLRSARMTWDLDKKQFDLTATDAEGVTRQYAGDYTDPVHDVTGPDEKLHRVFRIEFTQTTESHEEAGGESWQIAFAQQENNRYLLEVARRRGTAAYRRYDTVSTQRDGTSFAVSDSDYGDKTCIISQGLGTIAVSYQGKTYWVCCTGCKAAFEEDPATWIARAEKRADSSK